MTWDDHTCEECGYWDDINGCWANGTTRGSYDSVCPMFDGDDFGGEPEFDYYDDYELFDDNQPQDAAAPQK